MHTCANIVTSPEGTASAVLLRAGEIVEGVEDARARRSTSRTDHDLAQGPARLCVALGIGLDDNGADVLGGSRIHLALPAAPAPFQQGPRTGVSGEGGTEAYPWRFWMPGERSVSPYKRHVPKRRRD
jgi:DNA-3-methyladenine glycosylase